MTFKKCSYCGIEFDASRHNVWMYGQSKRKMVIICESCEEKYDP